MIITRRIHYAVMWAGLLAAIWLVGLVLFVASIGTGIQQDPAPAAQTDAIVVLTGGSERVNAGIELLKAGKGKKLLISGVHPGLTLDRILSGQTVAKDLRNCCIILGHAAESTFGNAEETLAWMDIENYHSLRLVTANYHMRRSLMIFRTIMPQMDIIPYPIVPDNVRLDEWWQRSGTANLLITEYNKYLWAALRLWLRPA